MTVTTDPRKTGVSTELALGSGTFAQMMAVTGMEDGDTYRVTNYGRGGSLWRYSSSEANWFPTAPVKVYERATTISGVAQTAAQVLEAISIEAGLLTKKTFRVLFTPAKSGTTDTMTPTVRMGANGTTADAAVVSMSALAAGVRSVGYDSWLRMASVTSVERLGGAAGIAFGGATTGSAVNAATTVATVASANYITITTTMAGTTDTPQLGYVAVEILP